MNPKEFEILYHSEDTHWWYLGMAAISKTIINRWYSPKNNLKILDAGCGTGGAMSSFLANYGAVTGFDFSSDALHYCRLRKLNRIVHASALNIPFRQQCFDLITSFDVLSDIGVSNDVLSLKEFSRILVHGGRAIIRLPAYGWLFSQHDEAVQTARRYNTNQIVALFTQAGLIVEHVSYANTFLFPLALIYRLAGKIWRKRILSNSDLSIDISFINRLLKLILSVEAIPVAQVGLPYGLSIIAVGRKP
jgi:SAM-dependent methyltransferase